VKTPAGKQKLLLRKRAVIETVNDELKNICQLEIKVYITNKKA